jgi:uncharacterized protein YcfL
MKWLLLSLTLLFAVGCQSTSSSSPDDSYQWERGGGCDH